MIAKHLEKMTVIIPMAGLGERFKVAGYNLIKPLLPIAQKKGEDIPMVIAACQDLMIDDQQDYDVWFIYRSSPITATIEDPIKQSFPGAKFKVLDEVTEGQASTCLTVMQSCRPDASVLIGACDNGLSYNKEAFSARTQQADCVVFTFKNNPAVAENPNAYGWVQVDKKGDIINVSVKKPISDTPLKDSAIVGAFWFRSPSVFIEAAKNMMAKNDRVNNEFYVDTLINYVVQAGLKAVTLDVDHYHCWGTPKDYEAFNQTAQYWKRFQKEALGRQ